MSELLERLEAWREQHFPQEYPLSMNFPHVVVGCAACGTSGWPCERSLMLDVILAAERRRQASDEYDNSTGLYSVIQEAERAEDAALDRLASHLRGGAA